MKNLEIICTTRHYFHEIEYGEEGHFRYGKQCSACNLVMWYSRQENERLNRVEGYLV